MKKYGKLCTKIYDLSKPLATTEELNLYTSHITNKKETILEPMCGSGRFYIPLKQQGYSITGFDLSESMLEACNVRCSQYNIKPDTYIGNITNFKTDISYNHVIIPIGSISLLIEDEVLDKALENIFKVLKKGGTFIFSFLNLSSETEEITNWKESMRYKVEDMEITCKQKVYFNKELNLIDMKLLYELLKDGKIIEEEYQDFPMKLHCEDAMKRKLKSLGFTSIESINKKGDSFSVIKCLKSA